MAIKIQTLPAVTYKDGTYQYIGRISCSVIGEMYDGIKVWQDSTGKQWTRHKLSGKYFFCEL